MVQCKYTSGGAVSNTMMQNLYYVEKKNKNKPSYCPFAFIK